VAKIRSMQQIYSSMKGRGSATSHLSSYAKTLQLRTQAAEDKVVDENFSNGLISTQTYLNELQNRTLRPNLTPLQRTNLKIKINDTQTTYQDEQIQTAYKTGGFYNGQKVDDSFMLAWEQSKLAGMDANSTAYQQQLQKIAVAQDKVSKAERTNYRQQEMLRLSQSPDYDYKIMEQKADVYQQLADQAKEDGDNTQYMTLQTTANNYKESAQKAKVAFEYQEKINKTKSEASKAKSGVVSSEATPSVAAATPTPTSAPESTPEVNQDGTVTPGAAATPEQGILDDISSMDWNNLTQYYSDDDIKKIENREKSLDNKLKAINNKIADAEAAWEKSYAATDAYNDSMTADEKSRYFTTANTQADLATKYQQEAEQMSKDYEVAVDEASTMVEDTNKTVANRIIMDKQNKIDLAIDALNQDVLNGDVPKEDFIVENAKLLNAKQGLFDTASQVFTTYGDETRGIDYQQKSMGLSNEVKQSDAYIANPQGVELIMNSNTGKVSPSFVNEDKALKDPKTGKSYFDVKYQKVGNAYVPVQYRAKNGKVLTTEQVKATDFAALSDPKKFSKEAVVWETVVSEEVDDKGNVIGETPEKRMINATFDANGDIQKYSYTDANGEVHNVESIPIQEANPEKGFFQKAADWISGAATNVGNYITSNPLNTVMGVGNLTSPLSPLRSIVEDAPQIGSDLRSMSPFGGTAYAAEVPSVANVPEEYSSKIVEAANKYGINPSTLAALLAQESWDFDPKYVSGYHTDGTGRGIAAIDKTWHPEITDEQAFDPDFSIEWAAKEFARLQKSAGSEFDALRSYNAGETGARTSANNGKDYANKVLERAKTHTITTPTAEKQNLVASAAGLRSMGSQPTPTPTPVSLRSQAGKPSVVSQVGTAVNQGMTNVGNVLRSAAGNVSSGVKKETKKAGETVKKVTSSPVFKVASAISNPVGTAIKNAPKIASTVQKAATGAGKVAGNIVSSVKKAATNVYEKAKKKVSGAVSGLRSFLRI